MIPSLGGFLEGWLLIVPKTHYLNLRQLPPDERIEFSRLKEHAATQLADLYGDVIAFEHGPARVGDPVGCGIDHAHLHLVPFAEEIRHDVERESSGSLELLPVGSLFDDVEHARDSSYIYLETSASEAYLGFSNTIQSQLVRRVLAKKSGRGDRFSWREDLALGTVERTIAALRVA